MIAPTPTPSSNADTSRFVDGPAPITAPRIAGAPAINPNPNKVSRGVRRRANGAMIASPSVVLCRGESDNEERAERKLTYRIRGSDREAFSEIVQSDADGNHQCQSEFGCACRTGWASFRAGIGRCT